MRGKGVPLIMRVGSPASPRVVAIQYVPRKAPSRHSKASWPDDPMTAPDDPPQDFLVDRIYGAGRGGERIASQLVQISSKQRNNDGNPGREVHVGRRRKVRMWCGGGKGGMRKV